MSLKIEALCANCNDYLQVKLEPVSGVFDLKMIVTECEKCREANDELAVKEYTAKQKEPTKMNLDIRVNNRLSCPVEIEI